MARATILAAVLLALAATSALAATDRQLLQSGVTCSNNIPACTERRCTLRTINNKDTYVCLRCMQGFVAAKQGSNILQCGEQRGHAAAPAAAASHSPPPLLLCRQCLGTHVFALHTGR